ncbi:MAG: BLUF domain-containing protein [Gammaproteobacteria bacterium]|nr:BLUF domain-containing protein [Gammaproteobacteria bacterium]
MNRAKIRITTGLWYIHLSVYISEYTGKDEQVDSTLAPIISMAKANNSQQNITDLLCYQNVTFIQIIESEEDYLKMLMKRIETDSRYKTLTILVMKK